jgi:hypothetical protein
MEHDQHEWVEFDPTSGRATAVLTVVLGVAAVVLAMLEPDGYPPAVGFGGVLAVVLAWAAALRPRVRLEGPWLVLQGMFSSVHLPLAAVQSVVVQQVLVATVADKRYANPAVGRTRFRAMRRPRTTRDLTMTTVPGEGWQPDEGADYADFVEERIQEAVRAARVAPGEGAASVVRREPAWAPIVLVPAATLLFVASIWL